MTLQMWIGLVMTIILLGIIKVFNDNYSPNSLYKITNKKLQSKYRYKRKNNIMTSFEKKFFKTLQQTVGAKYFVFPQIHLSALLDHKIQGQSWKGAFSRINGKSVDYVLCNRETLEIVYAIELDDYTHKFVDRQIRDEVVDDIFNKAGLPLIRFKNTTNVTPEMISNKLEESFKKYYKK